MTKETYFKIGHAYLVSYDYDNTTTITDNKMKIIILSRHALTYSATVIQDYDKGNLKFIAGCRVSLTLERLTLIRELEEHEFVLELI